MQFYAKICLKTVFVYRAQYAGNGGSAYSPAIKVTASTTNSDGTYLGGGAGRIISLIPSYQGNGNGRVYMSQQQQRSNNDQQHIKSRLLPNESSVTVTTTSSTTFLQRCHQQQQHLSQLPQPIPTATKQYQTQYQSNHHDRHHGVSILNSNSTAPGGYYISGSGSSSSATSSSPLSPPSISNYSLGGSGSNKEDAKSLGLNELNKLCRKSPFLQRRNGCSSNSPSADISPAGSKFHSPGDESPRKDQSVLSSIGKYTNLS